jgi:hypothetical protein
VGGVGHWLTGQGGMGRSALGRAPPPLRMRSATAAARRRRGGAQGCICACGRPENEGAAGKAVGWWRILPAGGRWAAAGQRAAGSAHARGLGLAGAGPARLAGGGGGGGGRAAGGVARRAWNLGLARSTPLSSALSAPPSPPPSPQPPLRPAPATELAAAAAAPGAAVARRPGAASAPFVTVASDRTFLLPG